VCARLLVEGGADINKARDNGATPLRIASDSGHEACMRLLVERGADTSAKWNGKMPVDIARERGNEAVAFSAPLPAARR
jgi:ankyrin repeat protein